MTSTDGDRLADWLERLGLVPHLAEAGLPTLTRDEQGRAVWTDPGTGQRLSEGQLAELDDLLHHEGTDPEHAVPVALLQLKQRAGLREELLASPWFTYETLADVRGATVEATRFAVHKAGGEHRLLVVAADSRTLVPSFQLTDGGELRPELLEVLRPLLEARMDPWQVWGWLTRPAALLGGLVPERAVADPEVAEIVVPAARRLAGRVAAPGR